VEVLSGMPYEKFVDTRILQPLGMKDTFYFPPDDKKSRIAMVYMEDHGKLVLAREKAQGGDPALYRQNAKYPGPELALFSTAADLFRFYQMLANKGTFGGKRIVSQQSVEAMLHDYTPDHSGYGLTLNVMEGPRTQLNLVSQGTFGHGGAFATGGWVDPKTGVVMVLLTQHMGGNARWVKDAFWQMAEAAAR
jgi:CubicO group peptidase (beta-lactamase class C family)